MITCSKDLQQTVINNLRIKKKNLTKESAIGISQAILGKNYDIPRILNEFDKEYRDKFVNILSDLGYDFTQNNIAEEVKDKPITNISTIFSSPNVSDLFDTMHVAEGYFQREFNRFINDAILLNGDKDHYTSSNDELNGNIKLLKNKLFKTIVDYLNINGALTDKELYYDGDNFIGNLYSITGKFQGNYNLYKKALNDLQTYLLGQYNENAIEIKNKRIIPNIKGSVQKLSDRNKYDAYNAAIMLSNFDNILGKYYGKRLSLNYANFNNFEDPINGTKYQLTPKGDETEYWLTEEHKSESVEHIQGELTKGIVESIQHIDKKGEITGLYLDMKDLYSLASIIKSFELKNQVYLMKLNRDALEKKQIDIEEKNDHIYDKYEDWELFTENPNKMLDWYINHILEEYDEENDNIEERLLDFKYKIDILKSLKNFIDKNRVKENNSKISTTSLLTQVLNNSYGTTYTIYNRTTGMLESKEMYSHNANRVELQSSIYTHLLNNITNKKLFDYRLPNDSENDEANRISSLIDTNYKLAKFINKTIGIYIKEEGAEELRRRWKEQLPYRLLSYLQTIRKENDSVIDKIIENEKNIVNKEYGEVKSNSEIIQELTNIKLIQDILDIHLNNLVLRPIMNISTLTGEQIPTFKIPNLMYDDANILRTRSKIENENQSGFKSLFLADQMLLGTSTKLEAINKDENKSAFKWNMIESFTSNFEFDFLSTFYKKSKEKNINVMIGNYSDKNSILAKMIDKNSKFNSKYIIGNNEGIDIMPITELLELYRTQMNNFYSDIIDDIIKQYNKLGLKLNPKNIEESITKINKYLSSFVTEKGSMDKDKFLLEINNKLQSDSSLRMTEELHYSYYTDKKGNKILSLNQIILDNYNISSNKSRFDKLVDLSEKSLIAKLNREKSGILFSSHDISKMNVNAVDPTDDVFESLLTTFGIDKKSFNSSFKSKDQDILIEKDGKINLLLKRWMWVNNLFRNEYLFISIKPEYMHPHKSNVTIRQDYNNLTEDNDKEKWWENYLNEVSLRMPQMSKRNVSMTATYEVGNKNTRFGSPKNVNVAVINDYKQNLYNISGKTKNQEVHDGSSMISWVYSKMIERSFPDKSYIGTKKQIGTFVTEFGSALKKDAETVITNDKIRNSYNSKINLKLKQEQMLSAKVLPNINHKVLSLPLDLIYYDKGFYYKIKEYSIENNTLTTKVSRYNSNTNKFESSQDNFGKEPIKVNTLYDIWKQFGAEHTYDKNFRPSEGSNELLYDLITSYNENGEYVLKENMIHIISNVSAFKSGGTNINPQSFWTNNNKLSFTTFENKYMGPQLNPNHTADDSRIKEITQIISALAQNPTTAYLAEEVYDDIAKIIQRAAEPYINNANKDLKKYYRIMSINFVHSLANSDEVSLAKAIAETFGQGELIPFSNQHFFRNFTKDMITKMNSEFITRYYPGIGAVLNPSHGMVEIFEDKTGKRYLKSDIIEEAFEWYSKLDTKVLLSNEDIINRYIELKFPTDDISVSDVTVGDKIIDESKIEWDLTNINNYYLFKRFRDSNTIVKKKYSASRDLKAQEITFKVEGINKNIYDLDSVYFVHLLNDVKSGKVINEKDLLTIQGFAKNFNIDITDYDTIGKYLNAWTQRNLDFLEKNQIMKSINSPEFSNGDGSINFNKYFGKDPLINKYLFDLGDNYKDVIIDITDYKFKPAELVLPNIYKTSFRTGSDSMNKISDPTYFKKQLEEEYILDNKQVDFKINLKSGNNPIYIKYVNDLPQKNEDENLIDRKIDEYTGDLVTYRVGTFGENIYEKPKNSLIVNEGGFDIIYIKVGKVVDLVIDNKSTKKTIIDRDFKGNIGKFIKSFKGEISSILPLMNNDNNEVITKTLDTNGELELNLNDITFNIFRKYSNYRLNNDFKFDNNWYINNREKLIDYLSKKVFATWQKSKETVSARIPAQSMQSFMEMENIGYLNTESNDAYVAVNQIWYQGSDFDIDKSYMMGYGFNRNAQYDIWSPLFDYSTKEELDVIENIPIPSGIKTEIKIDDINNFDNIVSNFINYCTINNINTNVELESITLNLPINIINDIGTVLRYLRTNYDKNNEISYLNISNKLNVEQNIPYIDLFLKIINKHNLDKSYVNQRNSLRNSIVSKIKKIISSPSNQILASEPVSVQQLHDAGDNAKNKLGFEEDTLSPLDNVSYYQLQENASVGKDDVGIGANGLKVFFALSNYYNSYFKSFNGDYSSIDLFTDPKFFKKSFNINDNTREIHTIANVMVSDNLYNKILNDYGYNEYIKIYSGLDNGETLKKLYDERWKLSSEQAAWIASAFVSGATDNAKELVMAKINAVVDLASIHLYLISLGYNMNDIAVYMNSDLAKYVAKNISGNIFNTNKKVYVSDLVKSYKTLNSQKSGINEETDQFMDIYNGAQEFKTLASILKVNQKTAANLDELNSFLSTLERGMYTREHLVLGMDLMKLRNESNWDIKIDNRGTLIDIILNNISNNLIFTNDQNEQQSKISKEYIKDILRRANNIEVKYFDDEIEQTKTVSLIGGQFDYRYYMNNKNYRDLTIEYYNLFKNTINIFDVIENSPHFVSMIEGVNIIHNTLNMLSKKYNFAFSKTRDIINKNLGILVREDNLDNVKNMFGNKAFRPDIDDVVLGRAMVTFDKFLISKWLKTNKEINQFKFSAKKLINLAGLSEMTFYKNDLMKLYSIGDIKSNSLKGTISEFMVKVNNLDETDDFIIDLNSDHGVANFKMLMEEVILKVLQNSNSKLGSNLKLGTVRNSFNLFSTQITPLFGLSSLNSPVNIDRFQELLSNFNEVDSIIGEEYKIKNVNNKWIKYQDLLYLYNLIVNNESYGDKRLTPLFEDYIKRPNNIGNEYLKFSSKVDIGEENIFNIDINDDENLRNKILNNQEQDILFLLFHKNGSLFLDKSGKKVELKNSNFPINTIMEASTNKDSRTYILANSIVSILKNKNLVINFNCD